MLVKDKNLYKTRLKELGMLPDVGDSQCLYFVENKCDASYPAIRIVLEQAEGFGADAVLLKFSEAGKGASALPQLYIYDRTKIEFSPSGFGDIQRRLWSAGVVPLAAVLTLSSVKLFSCRKEPKFDVPTDQFVCRPFKKLEIVVAAEKGFLYRSILGGSLWEDPRFASEFNFENSSYRTLLKHLRWQKQKLFGKKDLGALLVKRLLVLSILLKYLDERRDEKGNGVFPDGFFAQFGGKNINSLADIFSDSQASLNCLDNLSERFNGGIFKLSDSDRGRLLQADLSPLRTFLEGTTEPGGQQVFWRLYSFNDLPVELISNIYEEFLAKDENGESTNSKNGVVYTPPMLVEFLLDQCLPLSADSVGKRILDPSCGSGVFLVGAFRRLIRCWQIKHDWRKPTHGQMKKILRDSIFGVDIEQEAVLVTAFSLFVALCDELNPKVIWDELRFDDLRENNLVANDFFDVTNGNVFPEKFDVVIGNPPFESKLSASAQMAESIAVKDRPSVPDGQIALLFLDQVFSLSAPDGYVCLVQPAGPLLYNSQAAAFRQYLLDKYDVQAVFDFTPLDSILFKANVAAAAVLAQNRSPRSDSILHLVFRRTCTTKNRLFLEANYYDFHWLKRDYLKKATYAWKVDLMGGGRLHRLVQRFSGMPTLGEWLDDKCDNEGWVCGEGYSVGSGRVVNEYGNQEELSSLSETEIKQKFGLKRMAHRAPHLTGKKCAKSKAIGLKLILPQYTSVLDLKYFQEPARPSCEIFQPPHVLVGETVTRGRLRAAFLDEELVFTNQVFGVHGPVGSEDLLNDLVNRLVDGDLYATLLATTSSRYLVSKATSLLAKDIRQLPYPEDSSDLNLLEWEKIVAEDVATTFVEFRQKGERAIALRSTDSSDLDVFAAEYCNVLNSVYDSFYSLDPIKIGDYICYPFYYGDKPEIDLSSAAQAEDILKELCRKKQGTRLYVDRIIRLYEKNVVIMVKPNQKRFWLRSVALRDADETLVELMEAGF